MDKTLTYEEENLIKDMLKFFGNNREIEIRFQASTQRLNSDYYNLLCDDIFRKLQNGRLIVGA